MQLTDLILKPNTNACQENVEGAWENMGTIAKWAVTRWTKKIKSQDDEFWSFQSHESKENEEQKNKE